MRHIERHRTYRIGWLRAVVLGALLGSLAARVGGASVITAAARVSFWGALAMALTAGVGALFGVTA